MAPAHPRRCATTWILGRCTARGRARKRKRRGSKARERGLGLGRLSARRVRALISRYFSGFIFSAWCSTLCPPCASEISTGETYDRRIIPPSTSSSSSSSSLFIVAISFLSALYRTRSNEERGGKKERKGKERKKQRLGNREDGISVKIPWRIQGRVFSLPFLLFFLLSKGSTQY